MQSLYPHYDERFGRDFLLQMASERVTAKELARHLARNLEVISEDDSTEFAGNLGKGYLLGSPFPNDTERTRDVLTLTHALYSLAFPPDGPMITQLRERYGEFEYPPKGGETIRARRLKVMACETRPLCDGKQQLLLLVH